MNSTIKRFLLLFLGCGALLCAADLASVRSVYLLPMSHGLDQYLANRLTNEHVFQVVSDAKLADAVLSDHVGDSLRSRIQELNPPPEPPKTDVKADAKADDKDSGAKSPGTLLDATNKFENVANTSSVAHAKGTVFLVDMKSLQVVWSVYEMPKDASSKELDRIASDIVSRIKKDLSPKKK